MHRKFLYLCKTRWNYNPLLTLLLLNAIMMPCHTNINTPFHSQEYTPTPLQVASQHKNKHDYVKKMTNRQGGLFLSLILFWSFFFFRKWFSCFGRRRRHHRHRRQYGLPDWPSLFLIAFFVASPSAFFFMSTLGGMVTTNIY